MYLSVYPNRTKQLEDDSTQAREVQARAVEVRRQRVHKAALDSMAGETVCALFATMADRANGINVDGAEGKGGGGGGGGSREGGRNKTGVGTQESTAEAEERKETRRSGNQGGEEEDGPRREGEGSGGGVGGNQVAERRHKGEGVETVMDKRGAALGGGAGSQAGAAPGLDVSEQNFEQDRNAEVTRCDMEGDEIVLV